MPERPKFPAALLLTWLAVVAAGIALFWLVKSGQPLYLKLGVGGAEAVGAFTIVVFYLGRLREWTRSTKRIRELEREVQRLTSRDRQSRPGKIPGSAAREAA